MYLAYLGYIVFSIQLVRVVRVCVSVWCIYVMQWLGRGLDPLKVSDM